MAEKRMFSKTITESDAFLDLPLSTQALYFHLCIHADDDGFLSGYRKIMRMVGAAQNEYDLLLAKRFVIEFDDGIVLIKHWLMHNYIRKDRYKETAYLTQKGMVFVKANKSYTLDGSKGIAISNEPNEYVGIPSGLPVVDVDKNRIDKSSKIKNTYTDEFEQLYKKYPRSENKLVTYNHYKKILKKYTHDELFKAVLNYMSKSKGTEKQFLKSSSNFFGRDSIYLDYLDENFDNTSLGGQDLRPKNMKAVYKRV